MDVLERQGFAAGADAPVITNRNIGCNLRTQFLRILQRAGIEPWPKLFQNLRSTRETELAETMPAHVVCAWLGNTEAVAKAHYLQVTDAHFEKALQECPQESANGQAAQNQAQYGAEQTVTAGTDVTGNAVFPPHSALVASNHIEKWPLSELNRYVLTDNGF